ncbi:hypothetical protein QL285_077666 [Trifolium repens]|nr:hypothetical protein QL285_077666 [Trifolium repens]
MLLGRYGDKLNEELVEVCKGVVFGAERALERRDIWKWGDSVFSFREAYLRLIQEDEEEGAQKLRMVDNVVLDKSKSWSIHGEVKNKKKNNNKNINRIVISIKIVGSSGSLTILVNENDVVCDVIDKALKSYARQERLPVLGSDVSDFAIYPSNDVSNALSPSDTIGSFGTRKFVLCEKQPSPTKTEEQ